jgi:TRAP-type mannitol/chloroaromatic compound transport system substrate-binding protein
MVNLRAWEALPKTYQAMLETACIEAWHATAAEYDGLNPPALRRLVAAGTQLHPDPREVPQALYAKLGEQDARFKRVHAYWEEFRVEQSQWFRIAEDAMANFLAVASAPR